MKHSNFYTQWIQVICIHSPIWLYRWWALEIFRRLSSTCKYLFYSVICGLLFIVLILILTVSSIKQAAWLSNIWRTDGLLFCFHVNFSWFNGDLCRQLDRSVYENDFSYMCKFSYKYHQSFHIFFFYFIPDFLLQSVLSFSHVHSLHHYIRCHFLSPQSFFSFQRASSIDSFIFHVFPIPFFLHLPFQATALENNTPFLSSRLG